MLLRKPLINSYFFFVYVVWWCVFEFQVHANDRYTFCKNRNDSSSTKTTVISYIVTIAIRRTMTVILCFSFFSSSPNLNWKSLNIGIFFTLILVFLLHFLLYIFSDEKIFHLLFLFFCSKSWMSIDNKCNIGTSHTF